MGVNDTCDLVQATPDFMLSTLQLYITIHNGCCWISKSTPTTHDGAKMSNAQIYKQETWTLRINLVNNLLTTNVENPIMMTPKSD